MAQEIDISPGEFTKHGSIQIDLGNLASSLYTGNVPGNILGIPIFLEKWGIPGQFVGTLFPGNMQLSKRESNR